MGGGGGMGKSYTPQPYTPPQVAEVEAIKEDEAKGTKEAEDKARKAAALAVGRGSTILTGSLGDTSTPQVIRKTLLGQ